MQYPSSGLKTKELRMPKPTPRTMPVDTSTKGNPMIITSTIIPIRTITATTMAIRTITHMTTHMTTLTLIHTPTTITTTITTTNMPMPTNHGASSA